jgi:hypothetical protein
MGQIYSQYSCSVSNCFLNSIFVRAITFLSFEIGQWYLVCGCMTIRRCVAYRNDLRGTLTSRSNNCFLNSIIQLIMLSFLYLKQFSLYFNIHSSTNKYRENCFRYLKLMSPLNVAICTTISYTLWVGEACPDHNFWSFQIGQWYLVCGCMTIRRCVVYRNDPRGTLTSRSNNCFLNSIFLSGP